MTSDRQGLSLSEQYQDPGIGKPETVLRENISDSPANASGSGVATGPGQRDEQ